MNARSCIVLGLLLGALILGQGCVRILDPGPAPVRVILEPELPPAQPGSELPVQLVVALPETGRALDTDRIAILKDRSVTYLPDLRWSSPVPHMVQRHLLQALESSARWNGIAVESAGIFPEYRLLCDIQRFMARVQGDKARVQVRLYLQLVDMRKGRITASTTVNSESQPVADTPAAILEAFEPTLSAVLTQAATWTEASLRDVLRP